MGKLTQKLYEACLSATGAYEVLKSVGADKELPGYVHCLRNLNEAIAEYEAVKGNENKSEKA